MDLHDLRELLDTLPNAAVLLHDGEAVYYNHAAGQLFGCGTLEELRGKLPLSMLPVRGVAAVSLTIDGKPVSATVSGPDDARVVIFYEVPSRPWDAALIGSIKKLRTALREIRSVIRPYRFPDMRLKSKPTPELDVGAIEKNCLIGSRIADSYATLSDRYLEKEPELTCGYVNISELVGELVAMTKLLVEHRGCHLDWDSRAGNLIFYTDERAVRRILLNLISNAINAVGEGGKIDVLVYQSDDNVCLSVRDNGPGMPTEKWLRLAQASDHTTAAPSSGVGLQIVFTLTRALGGSVSFESEPNRGTTAIVRLPIRKLKSPIYTDTVYSLKEPTVMSQQEVIELVYEELAGILTEKDFAYKTRLV